MVDRNLDLNWVSKLQSVIERVFVEVKRVFIEYKFDCDHSYLVKKAWIRKLLSDRFASQSNFVEQIASRQVREYHELQILRVINEVARTLVIFLNELIFA